METMELEALREETAQLREALESRIAIEQAKGILAERLHLTIDDAFELLRYAARSSRLKLSDLAAATAPGRPTPHAIVVAMARWQRSRAAAQRERAEAQRERNELLRQHTVDLAETRRERPR